MRIMSIISVQNFRSNELLSTFFYFSIFEFIIKEVQYLYNLHVKKHN